MHEYWSPLDEELAEKVMGWRVVSLADPEWASYWPFWPRDTRMRLIWTAEDPEDACARIEVPPGTGKNGSWRPDWVPRFSSDMNKALDLCAGIRAKHGRLVLEGVGSAWRAIIRTDTKGVVTFADDASLAMAIAKAALDFCTTA